MIWKYYLIKNIDIKNGIDSNISNVYVILVMKKKWNNN